jgi:multidrug efflux pump subunit AcrB
MRLTCGISNDAFVVNSGLEVKFVAAAKARSTLATRIAKLSNVFGGVLSLAGMIARNAVILIEQVEAERKEGKDAWNAVIEATLSRFRPIMLTAISTPLGLIPTALTIERLSIK